MKTLTRISFLIAGILLMIACSKSDHLIGWDSNPKNDQNGQVLKNWCIPGTVYNLSGYALYDTWEIISGKVWQDGANECTGTLEFLEDGNFLFSFSELRPNGNGMMFSGKISPSGNLTFKFPSPLMILEDGTPFYITDVLRGHVCAEEIWGEGINEGTVVFYGQFNGNKFEATAKFMVRVASPCPSNDIFDPALVSGDLNWTFGYDLKVVKKEKD